LSTHNPTTAGIRDVADEAVAGFMQKGGREALVAWIIPKVQEWERWRQQNLDKNWAVYLRKWAGVWSEEDRTRSSERSRLISPALQQAVEEACADIEEAVFGEKEAWFDIDDDYGDAKTASDTEQGEDWQGLRLQLLDDMNYANVEGAILESAGILGALYGTAIAKVVTDTTQYKRLHTVIDRSKTKNNIIEGVTAEDRVVVYLEPVRPDQFVIDTSVNKPGVEGINAALGMAHRLPRPKHYCQACMESEKWWEAPLSETDAVPVAQSALFQESPEAEVNLVTEYHGLVPRALLEAAIKDGDEPAEIDSRDMVEAIVTIVDDAYCVAARENDNVKGDRDFIAAPYDLRPGSFWGRGIAEKGINAQRALDAMLRGQMDGMAFTVHPMMAYNVLRRDPRSKFEVKPGALFGVNGDPRETFLPLTFGRIDPMTFTATGELERLIQSATGTAGSSPARAARANATLGGMSLLRGDVAKRSKRTLRLLERHFLGPAVEKICLRHMQWNEEKYQFMDVRFRVRTSMSLMAREVENSTLVQLLQTIPPQSPAFYAVLGQIVQNTSMKDKGLVLAIINAVMTGQMPGSAEDKQNDPAAQLSVARAVADLQEVRSRTRLKDITAAEKVQKMGHADNEEDRTARGVDTSDA